MKRKLSVLLVVALLFAALSGCAGESENAPAPTTSGTGEASSDASEGLAAAGGKDLTTDSFKIAYVAGDLGTENNQKWGQGCQMALEGYSDRVQYTEWDCKNDAELQNQIMEEIINQGYDGIFLHPVDGNAVAGMVDKAEAAGIKVVTMNLEVSTTYTTHCGRPDYDAGVSLAHTIAGLMGGEGGIVVVGPPVAFMESIQRDNALFDVMEEFYPNITVHEEVSGDWSTESGNQITRDFITKYGADNIQCVWACNDSMALGAVEALEASGMEGVIVTGGDGSQPALQAIADGRMHVTLLQDSAYNAKIGVSIMLSYIQSGLNGGQQAFTPQILLAPIEVTADNVYSYYDPEAAA